MTESKVSSPAPAPERTIGARLRAMANHPYALWVLGIVSFAESSIFPIPPDILLIPMVLMARTPAAALWAAFICTVTSVLGGVVGYGIGYGAYEFIGKPIVEFYAKENTMEEYRILYAQWGGWSAFIAALTPIPYKIATILSGVSGMDMVAFITASLAGRSLRYFIPTIVLICAGETFRRYVMKHFSLISIFIAIITVGGFIVVAYLLKG